MTQAEAFATLARLRKAGFFTILWTPDEVEGVSDADLNELEEQLITKGNDWIADHQPDDDNECDTCRGTGEGQYDGTSCSSCRGSGIKRKEKEYDV